MALPVFARNPMPVVRIAAYSTAAIIHNVGSTESSIMGRLYEAKLEGVVSQATSVSLYHVRSQGRGSGCRLHDPDGSRRHRRYHAHSSGYRIQDGTACDKSRTWRDVNATRASPGESLALLGAPGGFRFRGGCVDP